MACADLGTARPRSLIAGDIVGPTGAIIGIDPSVQRLPLHANAQKRRDETMPFEEGDVSTWSTGQPFDAIVPLFHPAILRRRCVKKPGTSATAVNSSRSTSTSAALARNLESAWRETFSGGLNRRFRLRAPRRESARGSE